MKALNRIRMTLNTYHGEALDPSTSTLHPQIVGTAIADLEFVEDCLRILRQAADRSTDPDAFGALALYQLGRIERGRQ